METRHAADFLDVGAGHRLVIGDDGEGLDRRARKLALFLVFARQQPRHVGGGAEHPAPGDLHQVDAAPRILALQFGEHRRNVAVAAHALGDRGLVERLGGREQQRLDDAHVLRVEARIDQFSKRCATTPM